MAITLLPIVLATIGSPTRLAASCAASRAQAARGREWAKLVVRGRWAAAGGAAIVLAALVFAATGLEPGSANVDTLSRQGQARNGLLALEVSGIGAGALQPIEVLSSPARRPGESPRALRSPCPGIHGAVAPTRARNGKRAGRAYQRVSGR